MSGLKRLPGTKRRCLRLPDRVEAGRERRLRGITDVRGHPAGDHRSTCAPDAVGGGAAGRRAAADLCAARQPGQPARPGPGRGWCRRDRRGGGHPRAADHRRDTDGAQVRCRVPAAGPGVSARPLDPPAAGRAAGGHPRHRRRAGVARRRLAQPPHRRHRRDAGRRELPRHRYKRCRTTPYGARLRPGLPHLHLGVRGPAKGRPGLAPGHRLSGLQPGRPVRRHAAVTGTSIRAADLRRFRLGNLHGPVGWRVPGHGAPETAVARPGPGGTGRRDRRHPPHPAALGADRDAGGLTRRRADAGGRR